MPIGVDYRKPKKLRLKDLSPQGEVTLFHLGGDAFEWEAHKEDARREKRGQGRWGPDKIAGMSAFAAWGRTWYGKKFKTIYMRCGHERVLAHELLHFQHEHLHD